MALLDDLLNGGNLVTGAAVGAVALIAWPVIGPMARPIAKIRARENRTFRRRWPCFPLMGPNRCLGAVAPGSRPYVSEMKMKSRSSPWGRDRARCRLLSERLFVYRIKNAR
jgi:hypothetical protein